MLSTNYVVQYLSPVAVLMGIVLRASLSLGFLDYLDPLRLLSYTSPACASRRDISQTRFKFGIEDGCRFTYRTIILYNSCIGLLRFH